MSKNTKPSTASSHPAHQEWGSRIGVIFAVMGSAVGLGNFLRFPGLAASYSGGAFMIPYFIAFLLLGLPVAYLEWSIGRVGSLNGYNSGPGIFRSLWKNSDNTGKNKASYLGVLTLLVPLGIYMYYILIEGWTLYYAFSYLTSALNLGTEAAPYQEFFASFTNITQDGFLNSQGWLRSSFVFLLIVFVLNFFLIYRGLNKGIEWAAKFGIPLLFVIAFILLVRVVTLGTPDPSMPERNIVNGLGFMWNPEFSEGVFWQHLSDSQMWLDAAGQVFFTLSIGIGVIATYASYVRKKEDLFLSATTSAAGNEFIEIVLGGMILIPAAFVFMGSDIPTHSSFQLGFITMPVIFSHLPLSSLFGFLWFFLLFVAAVTSSLSFLQPVIAFLEEGLGFSRKISVAVLSFIALLGALFGAYFSADLKALDSMDFWIGSFLFFIAAMIQVVLGSWVYGADKLIATAQKSSLLRLPRIIPFLLKYVSPLYLIIIFAAWAYQKIPDYIQLLQTDTVARLTMLFITILFVFFLLLIHLAVKRWQRMEESVKK